MREMCSRISRALVAVVVLLAATGSLSAAAFNCKDLGILTAPDDPPSVICQINDDGSPIGLPDGDDSPSGQSSSSVHLLVDWLEVIAIRAVGLVRSVPVPIR